MACLGEVVPFRSHIIQMAVFFPLNFQNGGGAFSQQKQSLSATVPFFTKQALRPVGHLPPNATRMKRCNLRGVIFEDSTLNS